MKFHSLDTETTGLPSDPNARVIEIGITTWDSEMSDADKITSRFSSIVRPSVLTQKGLEIAWSISKINKEQIESAPSADQVWSLLQSYLDTLPYPVIAWNMPFDRYMIRRSFMGVDEVKSSDKKNFGLFEVLDIEGDPIQWWDCACKAYAKYRNTEKLTGLNHAYRVVCAEEDIVPNPQIHRAMSDSAMVGWIVCHVLNNGMS